MMTLDHSLRPLQGDMQRSCARPESRGRPVLRYGAVGALLVGVGLAATDLAGVNGLGLVATLPLIYFAGVALLLIGLAVTLASASERAVRWAWAHLVGIIVALHGLPGFVEPNPRFPTAWLHAGFAGHIASEGELLPTLDARFSWPGFFTAAAYLQRIAGTDDVLWMLRFASVAINLVSVGLVFALAHTLGLSSRRSTAAATIFVFINWIGQDYFAPQALGFILTQSVLLVVLAAYAKRPHPGRLINRLVGDAATDGFELSTTQQHSLYTAVLAMCAALIVTHQLSPPMLVASLLSLTLVGRIRVNSLWAIVSVGFVMWLSHGAEVYWVGHLDNITGSGGDLGSVLRQNVSGRTAGAAALREWVLRTRIVLMLLVWAVTTGAIIARRFRKDLDPAIVALFLAPFVVVPFQPYGGEVLLRVAYFTLPISSIVLAGLQPRLRPTIRAAALVVLAALAIPSFLVARFGNERYEQVAPDDLAVIRETYDVVPTGATVFLANRIAPVFFERIDEIAFIDVDLEIEWRRDDVLDEMIEQSNQSPTYLLVTSGQSNFGVDVQGLPEDWMVSIADQLVSSQAGRVVARRSDAILVQIGGA